MIRAGLIAIAATCIITQQAWKEPEDAGPKLMYTTAYCSGTTTATGTQVREGVAAVDRKHMGMTAIVYEDNNGMPGELIGIYSCEDTGKGGDKDGDGIGSIEAGQCIDIYRNDLEGCKEHMRRTGGRCWVQYVKAEG